jgi:hypothetical protein
LYRAIQKILKRLLVNPVFHRISSFLFGCGDVICYATYRVFGLDQHPDFFRSWQTTNCCFFPAYKVPMENGREYLKKLRSDTDPFGVYTAAVVFRYIPKVDVEKAMADLRKVDPAARLDPSLEDSQGRYPVCYCFGFHQQLIPGWGLKLNKLTGIDFQGIDYSEVCIGILGVYLDDHKKDYSGPFVYMPRLHLNRIYPTVLGLAVGLKKIWSRVAPSDTGYEVRARFSGKKLFHATFEAYGEICPPEACENFDRFRELLDLPLLSTLWGDMLYLYFDWCWEHSFMQPVRGRVECTADDIPCMPAGAYEFQGIDCTAAGAFRLHVPWELTGPFRRNEIVEELIAQRNATRQALPGLYAQAAASGGTVHTESPGRP